MKNSLENSIIDLRRQKKETTNLKTGQYTESKKQKEEKKKKREEKRIETKGPVRHH